MTGTPLSLNPHYRTSHPLPVSRDEVELGFPMHFQVMETSCNMPSYATNGNLLYLLKWGIDAQRSKHSQGNRESRTVLGSCDMCGVEWHWKLLPLKMRRMIFLRLCANYVPVIVCGKKISIGSSTVKSGFITCYILQPVFWHKAFWVTIQTSQAAVQDAPAILPTHLATLSLVPSPPAIQVNTTSVQCLLYAWNFTRS